MSRCKLCGTANSPDSSVCAKCGNKLRVNRNQGTVKKKKKNVERSNGESIEKSDIREEIFSKSDHLVKEIKEEPIKDLFSSGEALQKAKTGSVLEKIHKFEEVIGDHSEPVDDTPKIVPKVINREATNDLIRTVPSKDKDKNHDIPTRVIRSVKTAENGGVRYVERDGKHNKRLRSEKKQSASKDENKAVSEALPSDNEAAAVKSEVEKKRRKRIVPKPEKEVSAAEDTADKISAKLPDASEEEIKAPVLTDPEKEFPVSLSEADIKQEAKIEEELLELTRDNVTDQQLSEKEETEPDVSEIEAEQIGSDNVAAEENESEDISVTVSDAEEKAEETEEQTEEKPVEESTAKEKTKLFSKPKAKEEPAVRSREIPEVASRLKAEKNAKRDDEPSVKNAAKKKKRPSSASQEENGAVKKSAAVKADVADAPVKKKSTVKRKVKKKRRFTEEDISANKNIAALSYLGVLILIPFFKRNDSKFCKAHVRQGFAVFIWSLCISVITLAMVLGLRALILWVLGLSAIIYKIAAYVIAAVMLTLIFIPVFEGAVNAFSGVYAKVPFVGKFVSNKGKKKQQ